MRLAPTTPCAFAWAAICLCGCNYDQSVGDLADSLLDPEASALDTPGRQIAQGVYTDLELDASLAAGARLLALEHEDDESRLAVIPFEGGSTCHPGPATRFLRLASQIDVDLPPVVSYLGEVDDYRRGTLRFTNFDCDEILPPIEQSGLPQVLFPRTDPRGFLTLTGSGEVYFIDVFDLETTKVTENVRSGRVGVDHIWLMEEGTLVARNDEFEVDARFGEDVKELVLFGGLRESGEMEAAFIDGSSLYLTRGVDEDPELIAEDACNITDIGHSRAFAFESPCDEHRLTITFKDEVVRGETGDLVTVHLGENVVGLANVDLHWGNRFGAAVYTTNQDAGAKKGKLMVQSFGLSQDDVEPPEVIAEDARLDPARVVFLNSSAGVGTLATVSIVTGDDGHPRFEELRELADGVAQLPGVTVTSDLGVLVDYDGEVGSLALFSNNPEAEPEVVAHGVPVQRHARDSSTVRSAFVADFDGETGNAYLLEDGKTTRLGSNVLPGSLAFIQEPQGVAYMKRQSDSRPDVLVLYLLDAQLELPVHTSVSEYHALPWPSPGLLYSVSEGSERGIWFARAR